MHILGKIVFVGIYEVCKTMSCYYDTVKSHKIATFNITSMIKNDIEHVK